MADIIRVKPKKNYQWNQDNKFVYIRITMSSHTSMKKIDIYLSDLILRITSLQKKSTHFLDLDKQVDYKSPENKFTLTDDQIHVTLKKAEINNNWEKLLIDDISLSDLKNRRRQSQARYQSTMKQLQQNKSKLKIDYDRKATQQLMRFQQEQREKLENKKKIQKENAIKQIFSNVNQKNGKIQQKQIIPSNPIQYQEIKWREKQQIAMKIIQQQQLKEKQQLKKQKKIENQKKIIHQIQNQLGAQKAKTVVGSKSIFNEEDVQSFNKMRQNIGQLQYQQIPVRKANNIKVNFTQRIFPHLAARDTHVKEPPMPKNRTNKNSVDGDIQTKNPLWLKDKGDNFLKDKNYLSAIQAYTQAINIDNKMTFAYANRSLCHLKQFNFNGVINDCQTCLNLMKGQLGGTQQDNSKSFHFMTKIQTRKALAKAWKGQLQGAKIQLSEILNNNQTLTPQIKDQINKCIHLISQRQQSISYKLKGDQQVKLGNYQKALVHYDQSIGVDKNQYSISNKALCLNKLKNFNKSVDVVNIGIQKIEYFNLKMTNKDKQIQQNKRAETILLKLYYRKAKALQQLDRIKQAQQTLHKGLSIESTDKDFQNLLKQINKKKNKIIIKQEKQKAATFIKEAKHDQALKIYNKCLKMIQSQDDIQEYLGLLQNQCVCYLKANDFDSIISTAIRILKIINNVQSKIVQFGGKKTCNVSNQQMNKISIRTLMRRANAYLKKNQVYNAKSDLQKALQINPRDQTVQKELQKIKQQISA